MTQPKISIDHVSKVYPPEAVAVEDVTLAIPENSFTCLLGPSGCGKSTLLDIIAGFVDPTSGRVLVDGAAVSGAGPDRGVVFQEYALFPWRTALENVEFGPMIRKLPPGGARGDRPPLPRPRRPRRARREVPR